MSNKLGRMIAGFLVAAGALHGEVAMRMKRFAMASRDPHQRKFRKPSGGKHPLHKWHFGNFKPI